LTILRHAKSSWEEPNRDDFDRPLNERGWQASRWLGRELKRRKIRFDLGLASPAARARETLDGVAEGYGDFAFQIQFDRRIYEASEAILLEIVRAIPNEVGAALLVGHNPGLERLILELTRDNDDGLRRRIAKKYPTAAAAVIDLPVKHWAETEPSSGQVVELILPKDLD
jgi:phosphohistidine phosphatase